MLSRQDSADRLIDFIDVSPCAFQAVDYLRNTLLEHQYQQLAPENEWLLQPNDKAFQIRNNSALAAVRMGRKSPLETGFRIIAAHTDSPGFRIKPNPEIIAQKTCLKLNTEVYGGPILNTWLDRPLSIAGRVAIRSADPMHPRMELIDFDEPVLIIPNLAIHMNRDVNKGIELNRQTDILPIMQLVEEGFEPDGTLQNMIADRLSVKPEAVLDFDLFLYEHASGRIMGAGQELVSIGRLDNLESVWAGAEALIEDSETDITSILICFDNEEIGSATKQGADSPFLANLLERIILAAGGNREDYFRALSRSFMVSCDSAHSVHPNYPDKSDPTNRPRLKGGPVIKISANQKYTSDSDSIAVFEHLAQLAEVPVQKFVNRSDAPGGSTIGPLSATQLDIRSVDVGIPLLAMHSIRELCAAEDHWNMIRILAEFLRH